MFTLRSRLTTTRNSITRSVFRPLSTSTPLRATAIADNGPPPGNQAPSSESAGRASQPVEDTQSNASEKDPDESLSGDDHPAKQPDSQAPSERSTGFNEGQKGGQVKGGKEGLDQRTDK